MPKKKTETKKESRTRNFATVVYPESAPENWLELLDELHIPALISPLHNKDINPSGESKKPHYHVMLLFEGVKDFENQVKPILSKIGGVGREFVNSQRGYARYMCHLDNPEKAQYSPSDVRQLGGASYTDIVHLATDDVKIVKEIMKFIKANGIHSLAELLELCECYHPEWFETIATSKCYIIREYIKSLVWEQESGYIRQVDRPKYDPDTGEVIEPAEEQ